jgi:hypothetical protein
VSQYDGAVAAAEQKYGLPSGLLHGLMMTESGGNPRAVSKAGAVGLMQFMPATAKHFGIDPTDPAQAIDGAARYMAANLKSANGNVGEALRLYQGGPNKANRGPENAAYAGKVLGAMPGDSGDLAAMGFGKPASVDTPDLGAAGLSAVPDADAKKAREELDAMVSVRPAQSQQTQDINGIVDKGLKAGASRAAIRKQVYDYQGANGIDPTKTTGVDEYINYRQHGGKGAAPLLDQVTVKPLNRLQRVGAGLKQGMEDVESTLDPATQWLDNHIPGPGAVSEYMGMPSPDQSVDIHARNRALFNGSLGNDTLSNLGRVGGNVVASAPLIATGNGLLARAGAGLAEAVPAAAPVVNFAAGNGGGNLLARAASVATHGAGQGAMGAAAVSGGNDAPLGEQLGVGTLAGAILGPAGKLVGKAGGALVDAAAPTTNPIVAQLAEKAVNSGIDVRGSQISGSPFVRTLDSVLARVPGSGVAADNAAQRAQFTRAVGRTFGADSDTLTPDVMSNAKNAISDVYNDVGHRTMLDVSPERGSAFMPNLQQIVDDAHGVLDTNKLPALNKLVENVKDKISPDGTIPGTVFKTLTSQGSMLDKATKDGNSSFANAAKAIKANLNDALESSAAPEDAAALRDANWQWKNMKTVEKLVANSPDGQINPATLQRPVSTSFKNRAYTGAGDLGDLADIGQRFLKDQSSSNTTERGQALNFLLQHGSSVAGGMGSLLGYHAGLDPLYTAGAGLSAAAGASVLARGIGEGLSSDGYRNRLIAAALDSDPAPGSIVPLLARNYIPYAVAGGNRLLSAPPAPSKH